MRTKTFEDTRRQDSRNLIKEALSERYISFSFEEFLLKEHKTNTEISCNVITSSANAEHEGEKRVEGDGKGLVDALFNALILEYAGDCLSLRDLSLEEFYVFVDEKDLRARTRKGLTGTDAMVKTCLVINNGDGKLIPFRSQERSIILAMLNVVFSSIEFFINCEKAIIFLRACVADAERRNRQDLVQNYTLKMAELVKNGSYVESLRGSDD